MKMNDNDLSEAGCVEILWVMHNMALVRVQLKQANEILFMLHI